MDFDEHEDEEEMGMAVPIGYDSLGNSSAAWSKMGHVSGGEGAASVAPRKVGSTIRYCECLKNHAVSSGGHAVDGCGEFMAAGDEGTLDALKCAACNCHRNFHRKEADGEGNIYNPHHHQHHPQFSHYIRAAPPAGYLHLTPPPQHRPLALPAASGGGIAGGYGREDEDVSNPSSSGGGGLKKRFRTKFTPEQKDKMLDFAERLGWRIQKHDEAAVEQFCEETGVKRHVLKVWMHNNKHTLGKKP
ncbi:zinc-finger homeodomain protein 2-like [Durio zibethinus]|uniref:Zinc-finger homeodomain protein 2-like n=1 Tax=Durio zibethinus TaxID=66656 RepID=A0A6P5ZJ67_DURZI|nr:zinc-finger homeodomain protein 2-like [Durio zibethinus]